MKSFFIHRIRELIMLAADVKKRRQKSEIKEEEKTLMNKIIELHAEEMKTESRE